MTQKITEPTFGDIHRVLAGIKTGSEDVERFADAETQATLLAQITPGLLETLRNVESVVQSLERGRGYLNQDGLRKKIDALDFGTTPLTQLTRIFSVLEEVGLEVAGDLVTVQDGTLRLKNINGWQIGPKTLKILHDTLRQYGFPLGYKLQIQEIRNWEHLCEDRNTQLYPTSKIPVRTLLKPIAELDFGLLQAEAKKRLLAQYEAAGYSYAGDFVATTEEQLVRKSVINDKNVDPKQRGKQRIERALAKEGVRIGMALSEKQQQLLKDAKEIF